MHWAKTYFLRSHPAWYIAVIFLLGLVQPPAWATGTASGTTISSVSTLSYSVGDAPAAEILSSPTGNSSDAGTPTTFVVGSKINVVVAKVGGAATNVTAGQVGAVTTFSVTNNGNATQDYALSTSNLANGVALFGGLDNLDATGCKVFVETNGVAGYQPEMDTASFIDELQQDTSKAVYVVCNIPVGQAGDEAVIDLIASARSGLDAGVLGVDVRQTSAVLFADAAGSDDAVGDGKYSARDAYVLVPRN